MLYANEVHLISFSYVAWNHVVGLSRPQEIPNRLAKRASLGSEQLPGPVDSLLYYYTAYARRLNVHVGACSTKVAAAIFADAHAVRVGFSSNIHCRSYDETHLQWRPAMRQEIASPLAPKPDDAR